jgi:hypothetical protein
MAKRYVRATGKDRDGDITRLCNSSQTWSPRSKAGAINDIESGLHEYWVNWASSPETKIRVVQGPSGSTSRNNLDDLPDC